MATVLRLPLYLRELDELAQDRTSVVSSAELARRTGLSSEQIRKDLAYFGAFGIRGLGYSAVGLSGQLRRILGLTEPVGVVLVGAGKLGTAFLHHLATQEERLRFELVFDADEQRVGEPIDGLSIMAVSDMTRLVREASLKLAVIAVPAQAATGVLQQLVDAGVEAVLNFSPVKLVHPDVYVRNINLVTELEALSYFRNHAVTGGSA